MAVVLSKSRNAAMGLTGCVSVTYCTALRKFIELGSGNSGQLRNLGLFDGAFIDSPLEIYASALT